MTELTPNEKETRNIAILIFVFGFIAGYLFASAIFDQREITEEDMIELNKSQYYE
jgi:hypothetical protein